MIEVRHLTKRYGATVAVRDLSFAVQPGVVTGFLGPNGSGKSTTLRVLLGLDRPTSGRALVNGRAFHRLAAPLVEVGAMLDARGVHPGRSARDHLRVLARSNRLALGRVDEVLDLVGLTEVAGRRAGGFSLGMSQRLGIGAALLGDPGILVFDEPVNGLDTDGIRWLRGLLQALAAEGRTVLLSSHLMSEMELVADDLVVIGRGRLLAAQSLRAFIDAHSQQVTVIRTPDAARLRQVLDRSGIAVEREPGGGWRVTGADAASLGDLAFRESIPVHELRAVRSSLEDVYSKLTHSSVEFGADSALCSSDQAVAS